MLQGIRAFASSLSTAWQELQVNKLRTGLSLTGITIGIFCIIAVLTVVDSLKKNIENEVNTLGSDILFINRWPWMDEGGSYKWWEFWMRPSMTLQELQAVQQIPSVGQASLCLRSSHDIKYDDMEASGFQVYAVTQGFDQLQNIEIKQGRYLSTSEIEGGAPSIILGIKLYETLFEGNINPLQKSVRIGGRNFTIVGVLNEVGSNTAGFDYDNSAIVPYYSMNGMIDYRALEHDPILMVRGIKGFPIMELKYEVDGVLRRVRKVAPGEGSNYAINELTSINSRLDEMFAVLNMVGALIGGFSLIVGGFGIANIMFVSVKERTKYIGLKKAIGAKSSRILTEFLIESIMLCIAGGLIGIIMVLVLGWLVTLLADFNILVSPLNMLIGIGISALIGLLSGFIPAFIASRMHPVEAIRSH